jgi:hypothetical protein
VSFGYTLLSGWGWRISKLVHPLTLVGIPQVAS